MSYVKQTWITNDVITAEKLNHMENGIQAAAETELPEVTASDDGKILQVINGSWSAASASGMLVLLDIDEYGNGTLEESPSDVYSAIEAGQNVIIKITDDRYSQTNEYYANYEGYIEGAHVFRKKASYSDRYSVEVRFSGGDTWSIFDKIYPDLADALKYDQYFEYSYHNKSLIFDSVDEVWEASEIELMFDLGNTLESLIAAAAQYGAVQKTTLSATFTDQETAELIHDMMGRAYESMTEGRMVSMKFNLGTAFDNADAIARVVDGTIGGFEEDGGDYFQSTLSGHLPSVKTYENGQLSTLSTYPYTMEFYGEKRWDNEDAVYFGVATITVEKIDSTIVSS